MNNEIGKKEFDLFIISELVSVKRGLIISESSTSTLIDLGFLLVKFEGDEMIRAITPIGNALISSIMAMASMCISATAAYKGAKEEK